MELGGGRGGEEANFSQFRPGSVDRLKIAEDPPPPVTTLAAAAARGLAGAVRVVVGIRKHAASMSSTA